MLETMAAQTDSKRLIENRTFDEMVIGETASSTRVLSKQDIELFAIVSGDVNPAHLDPAYAEIFTMSVLWPDFW